MLNNLSPRELEKRRIEYAIETLEDALARCRSEDMWTSQVYAALKLLERHISQRTPLEQFCEGLQNIRSGDWQDGLRQTLNASLEEIKLAIGGKEQVPRY